MNTDTRPQIVTGRQGHNGTPTLQIATEVGVTGSWIFYHFKGKNALFTSILTPGLRVGLEKGTSVQKLLDRIIKLFCARSARMSPMIICFNLLVNMVRHIALSPGEQ